MLYIPENLDNNQEYESLIQIDQKNLSKFN